MLNITRRTAALAVGGALVLALTGCSLLSGGNGALPAPSRSATTPKPTPTASARAAEGDELSASASATPRPATPEPVANPLPAPTQTPIPQGTVLAEGNVTSPKGSIHFHYRMLADGDNSFTAEYSGFTSTLPVPVSVTLIDIAPKVGDGLTYHGIGDHQLGGPTSGAAPTSTAPLDGSGHHPEYLGTLVTYSSASPDQPVPLEIGPDKVLAVNSLKWSVPVRDTNVHPKDVGGAHPFAYGVVTSTTPSGAPKTYLVAHGDTAAKVAERFDISLEDLIWLNSNLQVFGKGQYLYEGTSLNLDPENL